MELSDAPEKIPSDLGSIPCLKNYATPGPLKISMLVHRNVKHMKLIQISKTVNYKAKNISH
jgi:hypothetical protein